MTTTYDLPNLTDICTVEDYADVVGTNPPNDGNFAVTLWTVTGDPIVVRACGYRDAAETIADAIAKAVAGWIADAR